MRAILYRVMRRKNSGCEEQNARDIRVDSEAAAYVNHHASEGDLVEVVVEDLAKRAAVVCATGLLAVDSIDCLVPEVCEPRQKPDPAWQCLCKRRIQIADGNEAGEGKEQAE